MSIPKAPLVLLFAILLVGATWVVHASRRGPVPKVQASQSARPSTSASATPKAGLAHIFVIIEENHPYSEVIGSSGAPYINSLASKYALATNYHSVASPSLPNYLALTSGSTNGVTDDCTPPAGCKLSARNLADAAEAAGVSWRQYAESMPSPCFSENSGRYATKHVPFLYYADILDNASRCSKHVVPLTQMTADLSSAPATPGLAFITPNLCNDGHDCPLATADSWLSQIVPEILGSKAFTTQPSLLVITWDEADSHGNHIPAILAGSSVKPGYRDATPYDHYSLLKTIEANWHLAPLTSSDSSASSMAGFIKPVNP